MILLTLIRRWWADRSYTGGRKKEKILRFGQSAKCAPRCDSSPPRRCRESRGGTAQQSRNQNEKSDSPQKSQKDQKHKARSPPLCVFGSFVTFVVNLLANKT